MKRILMYLPAFFGLLFSCTIDERVVEITGPAGVESDEVTLNFSVKVPGQSTPVSSTRSMSETAENYIETIDVLVFEVGSSGDEGYLYRAQGKNIQSGITASEKSFEVTLIKQAGSAYRLVVLANASSQLNKLEPIGGNGVAYKEELLNRLIYENTSEWNATDSVPGMFDPFPMWGESEITPITDNMEVKDLKFLRMTARVDVVLNPAVDNFKLQEVYVYNRQTSGHIVPSMADTTWTSAGIKVKRATVPECSLLEEAYERIHLATGDTACVRDIYLMESNAGTSLSDATCIVVGGKYGTSEETTYYRLDFLESDKTTYKDILRNHLYRFTINSVSGAGHSTQEEAFNALPMNMEAEILEWDQSEMSEVIFDGQYMLSVSQGEFTFSKDPTLDTDKHNVLTIYTNYNVVQDKGWEIEKIVDSLDVNIRDLWLDVDISSGPSNKKTSIHLIVKENTTHVNREGYIHIRAGRLRYIVKVIQTDTPDIKLAVYGGEDATGPEITELIFSGLADRITPFQFTVEWAPRTASPLINVNMVGSMTFPFDIDRGSDNIMDGSIDASIYPGGSRTYTVVPPAMSDEETDPGLGGNPFLEKSSRIDFTVSNGVSYLTKNIFLRQLIYGMTYQTDNLYLLDGGEHSFTVSSNTTWTAKVTKNPNNIIQLVTTAGGNNTAGEKVKFTTRNDLTTTPTIFRDTAEITFSSPHFADVKIQVDCTSGEIRRESNSYILKPGGTGIFIPVSRANRHSENAIGEDEEYKVEILWQDNLDIIDRVIPAGKGPEGYILVLPGESAEGNAVIAVKVNDVIKWSWHIWVTDYDPDEAGGSADMDGTIVMDRNLGAITNGTSMPGRFGLHYQWGRKDPFPVSDIQKFPLSNASTDYSIPDTDFFYDGNGNMRGINLRSSYAASLDEAIQNPLRFYYGSRTMWENSTDMLSYWKDDEKTIYDPCPDGWKVPSQNDMLFLTDAGTVVETLRETGFSIFQVGVSITRSNSMINVYVTPFRYYLSGNLLAGHGPYSTTAQSYQSLLWTTTPGSANGRIRSICLRTTWNGGAGYGSFTISDNYSTSYYFNTCYGMSVRCVKD